MNLFLGSDLITGFLSVIIFYKLAPEINIVFVRDSDTVVVRTRDLPKNFTSEALKTKRLKDHFILVGVACIAPISPNIYIRVHLT